MSWRTVVISSNAKLDYQMGYMVVRRMDTMKIHLSEMEILIVESTAVSLTAALLNELSKKKIKVIFCDEKRNPSSELVGYYCSHDTSTKIRTQITWKDEVKKAVWTEIVAEKIRKQAEHLEFWKLEEADMLYGYINELQFADTSNREGHAAKVYFNALFGLDFTRTEENSTNAALNYGYSLLLSAFNRCITANGYLTQLGLFHDNMFNQFNLASDLMEPFRPIVDLKVKQMQPVKFEHDEKMEVLTILQNEVKINGRTEFVSNAIKIYCKSVFDAINNEDVSEIKFYRYEL
ncbi:MAG: type II CRISPR-associated endonuclease Cas1 [Catonella sp.]|uniref:type II CRISPR-associated endonuclease Cas1 n=1 Tax=Catonella sp. TaxID=2382125 RepID=UPI003FA1077F